MKSIARVLVLLVVSVVSGVAGNELSPRGISWTPDETSIVENPVLQEEIRNEHAISLERMRQIVEEQTHIIIDARKEDDFHAGHIPGAVNYSEERIFDSIAELYEMYAMDDPIVVYCTSEDCDEADITAEVLREAGYTEVLMFTDGWGEWFDSGCEVWYE